MHPLHFILALSIIIIIINDKTLALMVKNGELQRLMENEINMRLGQGTLEKFMKLEEGAGRGRETSPTCNEQWSTLSGKSHLDAVGKSP